MKIFDTIKIRKGLLPNMIEDMNKNFNNFWITKGKCKILFDIAEVKHFYCRIKKKEMITISLPLQIIQIVQINKCSYMKSESDC